MRIMIINGPNLNLLGKREPSVYGDVSFEDYLTRLRAEFPQHSIEYFQSNIEGEIINTLQNSGFSFEGIIINAGGYTHSSVAIGDTVKAILTPVVEVHISNIYAREEYRHKSLISGHCKGLIAGFGLDGYRMALRSLV